MHLREAISLIQTEGINRFTKSAWADLGCGSGLFTRALADILPPESLIYAVDKSLKTLKITGAPDQVSIKTLEADFNSDSFQLAGLDGILMANSLHFVKDKKSFLSKAKSWFRDKPFFIIIEYDTDIPNPWVPYPLSFPTLKNLLSGLGYSRINRIHEVNSLYHTSNLYSTVVSN